MAGLQVLEDSFGASGLSVAGFFSNDFGQQGGSDTQIAQAAEKHGVKHDQFAIAPVTGDSARSVFAWILSHENPGPKEGDIIPTWNFGKYLFSRRGELLAAFDTGVYAGRSPAKERWTGSPLVHAIEAALKLEA